MASVADRNQDLACVFHQDGTVSIETMHNNMKQSKIVSVESVIAAIKSEEDSYDFPLFPAGLRKIKKDGRRTTIAIEYPEMKIPEMRYRNSTYKDLAIPRSVWISTLNNIANNKYTLALTHIFALNMPLMSENQQLYHWPFPNFSVSYGNICWGNDTNIDRFKKEGVTLNNLSSLMSMYFSANANDDLGWTMNSRWDAEERFRNLANMTVFDTSLLVPCTDNPSTFSQAITYINGRTR